MTKFFHYAQNPSGGYYIGYKNIIIEATDYIHANNIFNSLKLDRSSCPCCSRRWDKIEEEFDDINGDNEPMIFSTTVDEYKKGTYDIHSGEAISLKIIYLNSEIKQYGYNYKGQH